MKMILDRIARRAAALAREESGSASLEYAIVAAMVVVAAVMAVIE